MEPNARVQQVIDAYGGNPFARAPEVVAAGEQALAALDVSRAAQDLVEADDVPQAERLVLAAGHAHALAHGPDKTVVLPERVLSRRLIPRMPRKRGEYLRLILAAGRASKALRALAGRSDAMERTRADIWSACFGRSLRHALLLEQVIRDDDVLVLGETGTGKERVADAIQAATLGPRDGGPAPAASINAAAIPETLVESELFGHVKGSFTGATDARAGRIRMADGGTFFLDEVGDLPTHTQVKLLRVLETDEISPVGSDVPFHAEVRFVAATHRDLEAMVDEGAFRRDLYQRLAGNVIHLPPLRERPEDIPDIGMRFVHQAVGPEGLEEERASIEKWLRSPKALGYAWPGNVRELHNALRNLLLGLSPQLDADGPRAAPGSGLPSFLEECTASLDEMAAWYTDRVLAHTDHNLAHTARVLGIDRSTLRRRRKRRRSSSTKSKP